MTSATGLATAGLLAGSIALAGPAAADNYAPQLPSNRVEAGSRIQLAISGAQPGCRVTYTIRNRAGVVVRGPSRTAVDAAGDASSSLRVPFRPGTYRLYTRVDNFPRGTGCTPTTSVQRIAVV